MGVSGGVLVLQVLVLRPLSRLSSLITYIDKILWVAADFVADSLFSCSDAADLQSFESE